MPDSSPQEDLTPLLIAGGLGAAPFAGLIGERPITKDPLYNKAIKRVSPDKLEQLGRAGDVILTSRREGGSVRYKQPQLLATGSEFYHAEPVVGQHTSRFDDPETGKTITGKRKAQVIESGRMDYSGQKIDPRELLKKGPGEFGKRMPFGSYEDIVLLRPNKKLSKAEMQQLQLALIEGGAKPYSKAMGTRAFLQDLFLPKIKGVTNRLGSSLPQVICDGNMCSSLPATAWQGTFGEVIAKGKHPKYTLPADFLREGSPFTPVAASLENPEALKHILAKRMAFRGALGAGLAGTGVAAYTEPEVLPGIAAAAGAPIATRAVLDYLRNKNLRTVKNPRLRALIKRIRPRQAGGEILPSAVGMAENASGLVEALRSSRAAKKPLPKAWKSLLGRFGGRTVPLALGSGLAAYLGTKALTN